MDNDNQVKHPDVVVQLTGTDSNAFWVLGRVNQALKRAGYKEDAEAFMKEATSGDYDHLLMTAMRYVDVR